MHYLYKYYLISPGAPQIRAGVQASELARAQRSAPAAAAAAPAPAAAAAPGAGAAPATASAECCAGTGTCLVNLIFVQSCG